MTQKTYSAKTGEVTREWLVVDAQDQTLGRLATQIATWIRGKHKPEFTPHVDAGDFVVVINADKIQVTGKKGSQKLYRHHTGYIGHLKEVTFDQMMAKSTEKVIRHAVWGMLPHNRLGRQLIKKLFVYDGAEHPHSAQSPRLVAAQATSKN